MKTKPNSFTWHYQNILHFSWRLKQLGSKSFLSFNASFTIPSGKVFHRAEWAQQNNSHPVGAIGAKTKTPF